jgi:integration host factor subunit beta
MNETIKKTKTYTKNDIVKLVAKARRTNLRNSKKWVDEVFNALRSIMLSSNPSLRIEIRDFGVFEVKPTKSKPNARNPKSGEIIHIPPRRKTHFKPGKLLRNFLSQPMYIPKEVPLQ